MFALRTHVFVHIGTHVFTLCGKKTFVTFVPFVLKSLFYIFLVNNSAFSEQWFLLPFSAIKRKETKCNSSPASPS